MKIVAVGKIKEKSIKALCDEYLKRVNFDNKLSIMEVKDSNPKDEGKKILEKADGFIIGLAEEGKSFTSIEFTEKLKKINKPVTFVIGGPEGLSGEVKAHADLLLSLSQMTFTHEMARLFLLEQLYRVETIKKRKKYHK